MFLCEIKLVPLLLYNNHKLLPCVWCFYIKVGLVLHDFFFHNCAFMCLENFSNVHNNFWFNVIQHRQSVTSLIFCRRLAESDIPVMPSVTYMVWLHWWYTQMTALVFSSTALAFLIDMNEKCKSTLPSTIQVKNQWKTIGVKEKLDLISQFEKGEQIVGLWYNVRLTHSSVHTIRDNVDRIKESAECLDNIKWQQSESGSVFVARLLQS